MREGEAGFQRAVCELAAAMGWRVYHPRPARTARGGWRTALQGDEGFPDLVLARAGALLFAELKSEQGRLSAAQREWLLVLRQAGAEIYVWRPSDWDAIVARLAPTRREPDGEDHA